MPDMYKTTEATQSFEDAIRDHLIANRQTLVGEAVKTAMTNLSDRMKWAAFDIADAQLKEFFKNEVAPAIKAHLDSNREAIIGSFISSLKDICDAALKAHAEERMKKFKESYHRDDFIKAIIGK